MMKKYIVITSVNGKTRAIDEFERKAGWRIVIVGDRRSRPIENSPNLTYLSVDDQRRLGFDMVDKTPFNHYARKNIGYLYALREGADIIYDTDDDNIPYPDWEAYDFECETMIRRGSGYVNIYGYFSDTYIWPRGFPLDEIVKTRFISPERCSPVKIGAWQGLSDIEPDVDAIYRLLFNKTVTFDRKEAVALPREMFCPFNSQNTLWSRDAFPFLYLPGTVGFRFTDILRGYIAQKLFWAAGMHLGFHKATVYHERNSHDLMDDFSAEMDCFLNAGKIVDSLRRADFTGSPSENLVGVYQHLLQAGFVRDDELMLVEAWSRDVQHYLQQT